MKSAQRYLVIIAAILLLASCASGPQLVHLRPFWPGDVKLTDIEMPEYVVEDLTYDVILTVYSEETPQISRVCFRWLTNEISSYAPSLDCYAMNGTFGMDSPCGPWTSAAGPSSSQFCYEASDIKREVSGKLIVRIRPTDLKASYNMLEGKVEYISNGKPCWTNVVKTPVRVEK
jgi:hypothetical protein